ncbi:hypothetical protein [Caudoviricetes sp.]|nr:hypothetical protein [Caudoviricetes sp.]
MTTNIIILITIIKLSFRCLQRDCCNQFVLQ